MFQAYLRGRQNLLIWLLEQKIKQNAKDLAFGNPKGNCLFSALLLLY